MRQRLLALAALLGMQTALADGLPLKQGRYAGPVVDLKITVHQKQVIEHYRACQLERSEAMNVYTPYVFTLTPSQAASVAKAAGYSPRRFQVYETVRGFNDSGPHWNLVLRYSEDRFEVPVSLLLRDMRAADAEHEQGWKLHNPCFPKLRK